MGLSGIEIYKHLPKTNCKDCGFPTCLAFAMRLAQQGVELAACPHVSEEAKEALEAASRPPIRLVTVGAGDHQIEVGNETVMFRHEKTFYHQPGIVFRVRDTDDEGAISQFVGQVSSYCVERVGMDLRPDGFAVEHTSDDAESFARVVDSIARRTDLPLVLMSADPAAIAAALEKVGDNRPLVYASSCDNIEQMVELAKAHNCPLALRANGGLEELVDVVEQVMEAGVEDIVLDPGERSFGGTLSSLTQMRRMALKKNFRPLGFPVITFPGEGAESPEEETLLAAQHIAKYGGIVVMDHFAPEDVYPLLTLRLNIYTDPQRPIQMSPGLYQIGAPKGESPLLVTTNFSLTYFSIAGETEASGNPAWLLVCDTEGLSVLTGWAAGKFTSELIAKTVKSTDLSALQHHKVIIPGHVAVLSGELEEELPGWQILVGPREAVDIGGFLKRTWES